LFAGEHANRRLEVRESRFDVSSLERDLA